MRQNFSIFEELQRLEKVQSRCVKFANYLEAEHGDNYSDLVAKLANVVGSIEDVLNVLG